MEQDVWTVCWGSRVVAVGTGAPPQVEAPLTCDVARWRRPPPAGTHGLPDLHFLKILTMCLMVFGATVMLMREHVAAPELLMYSPVPRPVAYVEPAFRSSVRHVHAIPNGALTRIQAMRKALRPRPREEVPRSFGLLKILAAPSAVTLGSMSDVALVEADLNVLRGSADALEGGVVGGVIGGVEGGIASLSARGRLVELTLDPRDEDLRSLIDRPEVRDCFDGFSGRAEVHVKRSNAETTVSVRHAPSNVARCLGKRLAQVLFPRDVIARWNAG